MDEEMRFHPGENTKETVEHVASMLNFGASYFTMGIRGVFFSMPIVFCIEQLRNKKFNPVYDTIVFSKYTPIKAILVITFNFTAFFCFLQAARYLLHAGFEMGVNIKDEIDFDQDIDDFGETTAHISEMLNNGSAFYTAGIRSLYFAIPYFFWFLSPIAMVISTVLVVVAVVVGDSATGFGKLIKDK
ncbi:hypothetical protein HDV01_005518 [Terramyces sp. JEL0728]|nr:hypothetical protein HDV01_005518 [Terramyces sp. JEL0728]